MITTSFEYSAPETIEEALTLLAGGAKPLAGGMSLIPMMKLRLASPEHLVDLSRLKDLNYVREDKGELHIGAGTTHYDVESSPLLLGKCPLLAETAAHIGDIQVRNRGTLGGSVAHADPAADYPAALQALEAKIVLRNAGGTRTVTTAGFFLDTFTTALDPGEITEINVSVEAGLTGTAYKKFVQRASGFALIGIGARVRREAGKITLVRVGVTGLSGCSYRAQNVEMALAGQEGTDEQIRAAAALIGDGIEAGADLHASADYRKSLAATYGARYSSRPDEVGLKIAGAVHLPFPPERAYDLMQDPVVLAKAIPGCESLEKSGTYEYRLRVKMMLASLSGAFERKVRLTEPAPPVSAWSWKAPAGSVS